MHRLRERLTYSNVMATIAVFIALGGAAYALERNSVRSKHIKDGQVRINDADPDDFIFRGTGAGSEIGAARVHNARLNLGSQGAQVEFDRLRIERQSATAFRVCVPDTAPEALDPNGEPWVMYRGNTAGTGGESRSAGFFTSGGPCTPDVTSTAIGEDYRILARNTVIHMVPELNINSRWTVIAIEGP